MCESRFVSIIGRAVRRSGGRRQRTARLGALAAGCLFATSLLPATATARQQDDYFSLSLEQLRMVEVTTPSKRPEEIFDAPGIVTIVSAAEISALGGQTLFDILERLPGVFAFSTPFIRHNFVNLRGTGSIGLATHILVLFNGRPIREGFTGGINATIYRSVPLSIIDHLEIIRGPGSVLYGSNAFAGVLNVVTKEPEPKAEQEVSLGYGAFDTRSAELTLRKSSDEASLVFGASIRDSDGWAFEGRDSLGVFSSEQLRDQEHGLALSGRYHGFTINALQAYTDERAFAPSTTWPLKRYWRRHSFADVGYAHSWGANWDAAVNVSYTAYDQDYVGVVNLDIDDWLYELTVRGRAGDDFNIVFGYTHNRLTGDETTSSPSYETYRHGAYVQADYRPLKPVKLVAGLQFNDPEHGSSALSPRLGVILRLSERWRAKLLYGEAFRAAYPSEQFIQIPFFLEGTPGLGPERIATWDAQVLFQSARCYFAAAYFESRQRATILVSDGRYTNAGRLDFRGFELEGIVDVGKRLKLQGSWSVQENEDEQGRTNVKFIPQQMLKAGINYMHPRGVSLGLFHSHYSEPFRTEELFPGVAVVNPSPEAYDLLTVNLKLDLPRLLRLPNLQGATWSLYLENVLDETVHFPETGVRRVNTFPLRSGRAFYSSLTLRF